jgi:SAM-dependent methyltransferase
VAKVIVRWIAKALIKKVLSHVPHGDDIDYLLQRSITRSLPHSEGNFLWHAAVASRHVNCFRMQSAVPGGHARCLEFGAGWDLVSPMTFYAMGIRQQILVDISAKVHLNLVNHTLSRCRSLADKLASRAPGADFSQLPGRLNSRADLGRLGIDYRVGDLKTLEVGCDLDMISSISTLEHIPVPDLSPLIRRCYELLKPGGLLISTIDTGDHYAMFDSSITHINFLRYSRRTWNLFNSPLHYQNRLRVADYLRIIEQAGFCIVEATRRPIKRRPSINVHADYLKNYDLDELLCGGVFVAAKK